MAGPLLIQSHLLNLKREAWSSQPSSSSKSSSRLAAGLSAGHSLPTGPLGNKSLVLVVLGQAVTHAIPLPNSTAGKSVQRHCSDTSGVANCNWAQLIRIHFERAGQDFAQKAIAMLIFVPDR